MERTTCSKEPFKTDFERPHCEIVIWKICNLHLCTPFRWSEFFLVSTKLSVLDKSDIELKYYNTNCRIYYWIINPKIKTDRFRKTDQRFLSDCNWTLIYNHLVHKRTFNQLTKWLSVRLWTKWLWVQVQLQSLKLQSLRLLRARSSLHSGNSRVWILPETRTWHEKNIQATFFKYFDIFFFGLGVNKKYFWQRLH